MDTLESIENITKNLLDAVHFNEFDSLWMDKIIKNGFTDAEAIGMATVNLFTANALNTLNQLADVFNDWSCASPEMNDNMSQSSNESSAEETLWTVLKDKDVRVDHIIVLIYLLCCKATKCASSVDEKELGLTSARLYFEYLRVPGCSEKNIFHPNLFKLCIDCLFVPNSIAGTASVKTYVPTLKSLMLMLKDFNLGKNVCPTEYMIEKLSELCACEVQNSIKFDTDISSLEIKDPSFIISTLAYQSLMSLLDSDVNDNKEQNYSLILNYLNKHILCLKASKRQTIPYKIHVVKNNAVAFICHYLQTRCSCSEVTLNALYRLCLDVNDNAGFRKAVSVAVVNISLKLKIKYVSEMIQWILKLVDSSQTKHRVIALEVLGLYLNSNIEMSSDDLPESVKVYLSDIPMVFAILTRCDDISHLVRVKALSVTSQNMKGILQLLEKVQYQNTIQIEAAEDIDEDLDVNGVHRYFWYNMASLRARLDEIVEILTRRIEDNNVKTRKAALIALGTLIILNRTYLNVETLNCFDIVAKDSSIVVRKQMIDTLSLVLETYPDSSDAQNCWLKCILPLIEDPEDGVQSKAASVLEQQFLHKLSSTSQNDRECVFMLLKELSSGHFLSYQNYLQKVFRIWKSENKLKMRTVTFLQKYIDTEWQESILFYFSNYVAHSILTENIHQFCLEKFENLTVNKKKSAYVDYILKILKYTLKSFTPDQLLTVKTVISNKLKLFNVSVAYIPMFMEILLKSCQQLNVESELASMLSELSYRCGVHMCSIKEANSFNDPKCENLLIKCFCTLNELCMIDYAHISENLISILKYFTACDIQQPEMTQNITLNIRAHAFVALGKICLQNEILAQNLIETFAKELLTSTDDAIRNNLVIVLVDMCKRHTSFADKYVFLISLCLKDRICLIRYHTILLLVYLLQGDYVRWRGPLFYCLLSTLNDEKDEIREVGSNNLSRLLQGDKRTASSEHFIPSIFVFNSFEPTDNAILSQLVKQLDRFALKGERKRECRMNLYRFMLKVTDVKEKEQIVKSICTILTNIAEAVYPVNATTECIVRDCCAILSCEEMRDFNVEQDSDDNLDKSDEERRKNIIAELIEAALVSFKNCAQNISPQLTRDILLFEKDLSYDS